MSLSRNKVQASLELFELKPGKKVKLEVLKDLLPDASTALFFGKLYELDYQQLSKLLLSLFRTTVIATLLGEGDQHSSELQDYIIDVVPAAELQQAGISSTTFVLDEVPELLPELFDQLEVEIADSIKKLAETLDAALTTVQGKQGSMLFKALAQMNKQRAGVIGQYKATIAHPQVEKNLVVFDVSGSMNASTVQKIVGEVVGLAWKANAAIAIVSDHTYFWEPGTFGVDDILAKAEYSGTHYETLKNVFDEDWATVITIADYDSYGGVPSYLKNNCTGRVQQVLDISLVNRSTFLAECIGQLADKVTPLLVGDGERVISRSGYDDYEGINEGDEYW